MIQDVLSGQILTVKATNLPRFDHFVQRAEKLKTVHVLLDLFDSSIASKIEIRTPFKENGPMMFQANSNKIFKDSSNPYLIISYQNSLTCLAFPCSSQKWAPLLSPMRMLVADRERCGRHALWDTDMFQATTVDLSR